MSAELSKEHIASIFRVKEQSKQETTIEQVARRAMLVTSVQMRKMYRPNFWIQKRNLFEEY
jgi:hypothetical protein